MFAGIAGKTALTGPKQPVAAGQLAAHPVSETRTDTSVPNTGASLSQPETLPESDQQLAFPSNAGQESVHYIICI